LTGDAVPPDLTAPLRAYFAANAVFDVDGMLAPFAPDAIVRDERETHRGLDAIRTWIIQATLGNRAVASPRAIRSDGDRHRVTAEVSGAFPGSPITLTFTFRIRDGRIVALEIT